LNNSASAVMVSLLLAFPAFTSDPFNYYVKVKNFTERILSEKASRFRLASNDAGFALLETDYQKIVNQRVIGGRKIIEIRTGMIDRPPAENESTCQYLADTKFLNLDSPEITRSAEKFKKSRNILKSVEDFVYRHISEKMTGIPLMPAAQIFRNRQGDCTEHSVLAAAVLRKLKIPSRAVVGMYLTDTFQGRKNIFVYHMWVEALHDRKWRIVDAAMPGEKHPNRYIAFAYHNLKTEAPLPYLRAVSSIQNLTCEYRAP